MLFIVLVVALVILIATYSLVVFQYDILYPGSAIPVTEHLLEMMHAEEMVVPKAKHRTFWVPGNDCKTEILLFCPGNAMSAAQSILFSDLFDRRSVLGILLPEYTGYGESGGKKRRSSIVQGVCASVNKAIQSHPRAKISGIGYSLGCAVLLEVAATIPEAFSSISLIAPFSTLQSVVEDILPLSTGKVLSGFIKDRWNNRITLQHLSESPRFKPKDIKIFHAKDDRIIPFHHAEALQKLAPDRVSLHEIPVGIGGHLADLYQPWFKDVSVHSK